MTQSTDFPTINAFQATTLSGGFNDAFIAKLNPTGSALVYSTYLGGRNSNRGHGIAVDAAGNAYVTGLTRSSDFPTANALQPTFAGSEDAFVTKICGATPDPTSLDFGGQTVGITSDPQNVTLTNLGSGPLTITNIAASGDYDQTNTCGNPLAVGESCTISVTFTPTAGGTRAGEVTITDDACGNPYSVSLTGTGLVPVVTLPSTSLTFADQVVQTTSDPQTVTLTNTGDGLLAITSIAVSGDFAETDDCGASVAAGESCTFSVTFTPTAAGSRTGAITITDNGLDSPHTIALSGTGTDFSIPAPGSQTEATVTAGQTATYDLTLSPDGFSGAVSLSCSGAPTATTCSVSPSSLTLDGTTDAMVTVTVRTTARSMLGPPAGPQSGLPWLLWLLSLAMLASLATAARRQRVWMSFALPILFVVLWTSCGSGGSPVGGGGGGGGGGTIGTPPGTFPLTVTATSGGGSRTIPLTLTVN